MIVSNKREIESYSHSHLWQGMHWKLKQRQLERLSREKGTVRKDWGGKLSVALVFANTYAVGMSNLGFQAVYGALNQSEEIVCERVFYPDAGEVELLRAAPGKLLSVESQRPLADFDLIAFSVPFENDYPHVLEILAWGGIPARAEERGPEHPWVAGGGVALFLNPEPLAPFLDFVFVGEAEAILPDFFQFSQKHGQRGQGLRQAWLQDLARSVSGVYVPSLYTAFYRPDGTLEALVPASGSGAPDRIVTRRAILEGGGPPCRTVILTPETEFSDVVLLEIGRGCGRGCRFCAAGYVYRPVRTHELAALIDAVADAPFGSRRLGLVSAAVSDHPQITSLCDTLLDRGALLSFSSLRADSITQRLASVLEASQHQSVAIAPEAGSERLRRVVNKNLTEDEILEAADRLTAAGILHLKLYFMIGLPTETPDDLEAIVDVTKRIKHHVLKISRGQKRLGTVTLSVNSFVPKPFTPFQWVPFAGVKELKEKARWIQKALQKVSNVRVHFDLPKWAYVQALLSRGDRRVSTFLEKVALEGASWSDAMKTSPLNPDFWVMRERDATEHFPWEVIDHGIRREYLWEEYERALRGQPTPPCPADRNCRRCGVCRP